MSILNGRFVCLSVFTAALNCLLFVYSVVALSTRPFTVGDMITMQLMERQKVQPHKNFTVYGTN